MRVVTQLPYHVEEQEHLWITTSDGIRLAARLWLPVAAHHRAVPAVLEMIPYRKRDLTAVRDSIHHPYIAGHGYACLRVDLRGSGDSEGVLTDEYLDRELHDAVEVLAWLADQPWCNGQTAMMGISWGGFNALQVAARQPPSLGTIITVCSSDDRYTDDVHYMGGCLLSDNLSWASTMFAYTSSPPDPEIVGDAWRQMWHERLTGSGLWLEEWLRHQRRDDYWRHGSIDEDYAAVQVPVLAASGWADGYSNTVFRLLEHLEVPAAGLIGPWSHKYPHLGQPGPAIGFLQEVVAWLDHWLGGQRDNGVADWPALRVWLQDTVEPSTTYARRPGRWVGEESWPSPHIVSRRYPLDRHRIAFPGEHVDSPPLTVQSPLSVGMYAGKWTSHNTPPDLPYDQRNEDGGSLVFDSDPLPDRLELLGSPVLEFMFAADRPVAMVAVRISDVAPDGKATRVSYGVANLNHLRGPYAPEALSPGVRRQARVQLNGLAQSFPAGHRIRLAISTSYWPLAWPSPLPVRLEVFPAESSLVLPLRPRPRPAEELPVAFGPAEGTPPLPTTQVEPGEERWMVHRDLVRDVSELEVIKDLGTVRFDDIELEVTRRAEERYSFTGDDFSSVRGETAWTMGFRRSGWRVRTETRTYLTSSVTHLRLHAQLDAYEGEERVVSKNWHADIPRDFI